MTTACMRPERAGFWCMLGGPGSRRQHHLRGRTRRRSSRPSSTAGPLSRRGRPATVGGQVSAGRKQLRGHNRERGPYPPTASPSAGPGVRRFWLPAIDSRIRGKSLSQKRVGKNETRKEGTSPMCVCRCAVARALTRMLACHMRLCLGRLWDHSKQSSMSLLHPFPHSGTHRP